MRHGKPNMPRQLIRSVQFGEWIENYNIAHLCETSSPSDEVFAISAGANAVICSSLQRSTDSALRLGLQPTITDSIFREMEMPHWSFVSPPLPAKVWSFLFRLCWFAGLTSHAESFKDAKVRASNATKQLIKHAQDHQKIIFVGHGMLNRFIAKALLQDGWVGPKHPGGKYWEFGIYNYETN